MRLSKWTALLFSAVLLLNACSKKSDAPSNPAPTSPACVSNTAPSNGSVVAAGSTVTLTWSAASGATSYDVYLSTSTPPTTAIVSNTSTTSATFTVGNIVGTTYYWYVVPKNATGAASGCTSSISSFSIATPINIQAPPAFGYYVVGYFPSYRNLADIPDVKFRMCNVINYAFFAVNSSNGLTVPANSNAAATIAKGHANGAKVFMSINDGAGDGKTNFKAMASSPANRLTFIKDVMSKVRQYGFDGVDVDWEYPTTSDGSDVTFTALMKELSDSLHRDAKYYLTAAITPGKYAGGTRDAIKAEVFNYIDFFNVMAYDDFSTTVPYKQHSDYNLAVTCLNYWLNTRGMPKAKCVLGFPAYGRPSGITQSNTILTYKDILSRGGSPLSDSAVVTAGGFTNYTIYYNGQPTVKKKAMLAKQQANGVVIWEKGQDAMDANSLLKAVCDTVGRSY